MTETEYDTIANKALDDLRDEVGGSKIERKKMSIQTN